MKWIRRLIFLVILLVVLLGVGMFYADDLAKTGIEKGGSDALGVPTTVESCDVGFFSTSFGLENLDIANPEGFGDDEFLHLGRGKVEVSATSLMSDKIEVPLLELSEIRVNLIHGADGSNYGKIMENLEKFQGQPEEDKGEGKRFVVEKILVKDVVVKVVPMKELFTTVSIPIDEIELKDVGSDSDKGVLLSDLAGILVESILTQASLDSKMPAMVSGALKGQLGKLSGLKDAGVQMLDGLGKQIGGAIPGGLPDPKKVIGDPSKAIKGITDKLPFGGKK